jgi:hypothetical protein
MCLSGILFSSEKKMGQGKKTFFLIGVLSIFCFFGNRCNVPETFTISDADITLPLDTGAIYKFVNKLYYILVPGDTALFYGSRQCTLSTNGIIDTCILDSAYLQMITQKGVSLEVDDTVHFVYPQVYHQGSKFSEITGNTLIRYMEKSDSGTLQLAFKENGTLTTLASDRRMIMPRTLIIGPFAQFVTDSTDIPLNNTWPSAPLMSNPIPTSPGQGQIHFNGYSTAVRVIAPPKSGEPPYMINNVSYTNGIFVKTYFALSGEMIEDGDIVRVTGSMAIIRSYFVERGIIDQSTFTSVVKIRSDGTIQRMRERIYVARGPEGAKQYSENTDTLSCPR